MKDVEISLCTGMYIINFLVLLCCDEEDGDGYDEAAYYYYNGLGFEAYLDDRSSLTVETDCFKVVQYANQ